MKNEALNNVVADRLQELLEGGSMNAFALRCGISTAQFARWCNRVSLPSADGIVRIARTTGVSADWILGLTDSRFGAGSASARSVTGPAAAASGSGTVNLAAFQTSRKALEDLAASNRALTETNALLARSLASRTR